MTFYSCTYIYGSFSEFCCTEIKEYDGILAEKPVLFTTTTTTIPSLLDFLDVVDSTTPMVAGTNDTKEDMLEEDFAVDITGLESVYF